MGVSNSWSRKKDALRALHIPTQRHFGPCCLASTKLGFFLVFFFNHLNPQSSSEKPHFYGEFASRCRKFHFFAPLPGERGIHMLNSGPDCNSKKNFFSALKFSWRFCSSLQGFASNKTNSPELWWTARRDTEIRVAFIILICGLKSKSLRASNSQAVFRISACQSQIEDL